MAQKLQRTGVLRGDLELLRGEVNLLFDRTSESYYQLPPQHLEIISHLNQDYEIGEFHTRLQQQGCQISRAELDELLEFLRRHRLTIPGTGLAASPVVRRPSIWAKLCGSIFFFRLPPYRPGALFDRIKPWARHLADRKIVYPLAVIAAVGYLSALRELPEIHRALLDSLSWRGLVNYFWAIVLLKLWHEMAHSAAALHFNCPVRGIGLGFMLFYPRLYTDVTDSYRLPRRQRLLIASAGVIAELLAGGVAALLWQYLVPGAWRSTMFYIFTVSVISSVLVNGNPGIRYDGYYVLCDFCNMPNLLPRGNAFYRDLWRYFLLGVGKFPREKHPLFLLIYGLYAFIYRIFLYTSIIAVIYYRFTRIIAVILLIMEFYLLIVQPLSRELRALRHLKQKGAFRRARCYAVVGVAGLGLFILFFPWPSSWYLPGETAFEHLIPVNVAEAGVLHGNYVNFSRRVHAGEKLWQLHSMPLDMLIAKFHSRRREERLKLRQQQLENPAEANLTAQKIAVLRRELYELFRRRHRLNYRAVTSGFWRCQLPQLQTGAYLPQGTPIGEVHSGARRIRGYATDQQICFLRPAQRVEIYFPDRLSPLRGQIKQISPLPTELVNSVLLQNLGGTLPIEAHPDFPGRYRNAQTLYAFTVEVPEKFPFRPGRSVQIRVPHATQLAARLWQGWLTIYHREF